MPQATIRCVAGAALFSAVVSGLSYGSAERRFDRREQAFRDLAMDECMANDPSNIPHNIDGIQRLQTLHRVCHYSISGEIEP